MDQDNDELMEQLFKKYQQKTKKTNEEEHKSVQSRKRQPDNVTHIQSSHHYKIDVEEKRQPKQKFQDLPQNILFYLTQIYPFSGKLFLTGLMQNGQTLNVVANDLYRQLYFVLRRERVDTDEISEDFLAKAENEVRFKLRNCGLQQKDFTCEFQEKQYVFQIQGIPRQRRPYLKVRFSFKHNLKQQPEPDWEGETFKFVIGTTYSPLQLLIINKVIKGPCWIQIQKSQLKQNYNSVDQGLCVDIGFSELLEVKQSKTDPPNVRVLSFSVKAVIPSMVSTKKYFPTERKDQTHIYAISYNFCSDYKVSIKDPKPHLTHKTFYLKTFGEYPNNANNEFVSCENEITLLSRFEADLKYLDPDFLVCHDSSKILDTLICRMIKLGKNKSKIGRLNVYRDVSKTNQVQRINTFIAGRLLVDTFLHSKEMIKSIDYELQSMAKHVKPERNFVGISDEEAKVLLSEAKPFPIINKCSQQSELAFNLMNHLQLLQMTRQLSNICGNLWKRSLENKRAQRNQFLIMHNCKERNLIIPDKFKKNDDEEVETKKKYQGGMVLQPDKGYYSEYILLLDFNSLYPSIIREYNVCFSIIDRPKLPLEFYYKSKGKKKKNQQSVGENREEEQIEEMFQRVKNCDNRDNWGFLPQLIDKIVERRKVCKRNMKKAKNPVDKIILDIQQKCYKLVANSIYGCLGFSVSRFYSRPLAALITKKGRDSLLAAKDIVSKRGGVRVIYGDTDSLMIEPSNLNTQEKNTEVEKLKKLKVIADELKIQINKMYTFLEIDIDGIFKPLILLMKKKYVANTVTNYDEIITGTSNQPKFALQFKGIETVRRDGCKLARDTLEKIIQILVNVCDKELDQRYQEICDYFTRLKAQIQKKPLEDFLFSKQLSKKPKEYVNGQSLPHVKVALDRLKNGEKQQSLVNHTIYYLICKSQDEHDSLAKCAFDKKSFERSRKYTPDKPLQIDYDYYKSVIMEPIGRLLAHINSQLFDQIIEQFQVSKRRTKALKQRVSEDADQAQAFGETLSQNFKGKARQLNHDLGQFTCPNCQVRCNLVETEKGYTLNTVCTSCKENPFNLTNVIYNKIWYRIKQDSAKYYNNRKTCKCTKHYHLTPITPCCQIDKKYKGKGDIIFKLHNFLYICKDMCQFTLQKSQRDEKSKKGLQKIVKMVEHFLEEQSKYEDVSDIFSKLRL